MTEKRIFEPEGRRNGDRWLSRLGKIVVIATAVAVSVAFVSDRLGQIKDSTALGKIHTAKIEALEAASSAMAYMVCVDFAASHPVTQVPTFCNGATRANTR
jgi:hypothetical protein